MLIKKQYRKYDNANVYDKFVRRIKYNHSLHNVHICDIYVTLQRHIMYINRDINFICNISLYETIGIFDTDKSLKEGLFSRYLIGRMMKLK